MGVKASLRLLDLQSDATVGDANRAYVHLHRMIELFHRDHCASDGGHRHEDLNLLSSAYAQAIAFLGDAPADGWQPPSAGGNAGDAASPAPLSPGMPQGDVGASIDSGEAPQPRHFQRM